MDDTIYSLFEQQVRAHPDAPAIIEDHRTLTFRELSDLVCAIASGFPEEVRSVGVVMQHRAEMIAALLAILKRCARYVPAEPTFPKKRIRFMMEEAQVDFILTDHASAKRLEGLPERIVDCAICAAAGAACDECDSATGNAGATPHVLDASAQLRNGACSPDDAAYVLYTSGTTGRPKGVCVANGNVCHYVRAFEHEFHVGPGDIMLQYSVCSFDIFVEEVFCSLLNGAALAIPSADERDDIGQLMAFIERHGVTMLSGFPYLLAKMNHLPSIPSSLRLLISGGDVLRAAYVDNLLAQAEVYNTYGPSETTVCASYFHCNGHEPLEDGTYPIGTPVLGAQIVLLDAKGNQVPEGEIGEVCITGGGVSQGYIGDHDEENRAFEHLSDGTVRYHSGDLGYWLPDGSLAFLHRKDTQVMIEGRRVEVSEVESVLYQCAGVDLAVVHAYTDEHHMPYLVAYVVLDAGVKVSQLRAELAESLADFMIPEFFVQMPRIPLNSNGKPDAKQLPVVMKEGQS